MKVEIYPNWFCISRPELSSGFWRSFSYQLRLNIEETDKNDYSSHLFRLQTPYTPKIPKKVESTPQTKEK